MRKKFLMQLPPLMKDLNEGMELIGWPEAAQQGLLRQAAAGARRVAEGPAADASSTTTCCVKQLEAIFAMPVPTARRSCRRADAGCRGRCRRDRAALHAGGGQAGRPGRRERGRLVRRRSTSRRRPSTSTDDATSRRCRRRPSARDARSELDGSASTSEPASRREPTRGAAADRPHQARLRLPDAPEGRVAEGAARRTSARAAASSSSRAAASTRRRSR